MKTIILLIALVLSNLGFSCVILPNGKYIPCDIREQIIEQDYWLKHFAYNIAEIENVKTNIEYNVKLAESRMNEAEVKYIESIKKYKTALHNAASKSFKQKVYSDVVKQAVHSDIVKQKTNADIVIQKANAEAIATQKVYSETIVAKQKAYNEMICAKVEYEKACWECGRIYAISKGESDYRPVGKSPLELFKLVK